MTWPFENDTSAITKKLAKKSLQSEKRRNLMVVIAVALAAFLICFTGIVSTSLTQMQRNQVVDTYEAVWLGVEENDIETLKGLPEFERVGGYYMLGEELSEQGYHASYVYCDAQMMEITKAQMELLEGRVPEKANEVVVSEYFLSTYGNNAKIGDTVTLDTESFHGDYVVTGIMDSVNEKEANTCAIILSNAALTGWKGFDPTGYRAYVHFKNSDQLGEELMTSYCREIAEEYQLPMPKMNSKYFAYASKSFDFALMAGVIAIVLIGGYIVIQSIFRISINDKIKSYGQLRTIGATPKQIKRIVKREGRKLGSIGILIGTVLGVCGGFLLFPKGFNAVSYVATIILTLISSWIMVSVSIRKPIKIAAGISPIEAVRFTPAQKDADFARLQEMGFIHGNISPDNLIFSNAGSLKLTGFGYVQGKVSLKSDAYAAVEMFQTQQPVSMSADVYALCASIYRCITGAAPQEAYRRMSQTITPVSLVTVVLLRVVRSSNVDTSLGTELADSE